MKRYLLLIVWVLLAGSGFGGVAEAAILVATNSVWGMRKGTNEASAPLSAWRQRTYEDGSWGRQRGPFYYGESISTGTVLADMRSNYTSLFLRQAFRLTNAAEIAALDLMAICDDGFVSWINGFEVVRQNVPEGERPYNGVAAGGATEPVAWVTYPLSEPKQYLVSGTNVLAVQVFNVNSTSSDLVFDAQLASVPADTVPPRLVSVSPGPGNVSQLTQVSVSFSEPVTGVDAMDLLLNSNSATGLTGSGSNYVFTFPQPAFGDVDVRFAADHGITDLGRPSNPFDALAAEASWHYYLADSALPVMASLHPAPGTVVRRLEQVEVTFTEPVGGVDAGDLLVNGLPAANVTGYAAGPYLFEFPAPAVGTVRFEWAAGHGITDLSEAANPFPGSRWSGTLNPAAAAGDLVLNEFIAPNEIGLKDEEGEFEDWIEIRNRGNAAVNLTGWSLSDDPAQPGQWTFPAVTIGPGQFLVVFASGKDRRSGLAGAKLHTNFKLSAAGEFVGLYNNDSPRTLIDAVEFPEQRTDYSYGRDGSGSWKYFKPATPGLVNGASSIIGLTPPVRFSVQRGFFSYPFNLTLSSAAAGARIFFTTNGSEPTEAKGTEYAGPIPITKTTVLRAIAVLPNHLPSRPETHSYFFGVTAGRRSLPALSLVTATNNLVGRTGIMEINPRNTTKHGIAWERPVSAEWIRPEDYGGFQIDAGLRIQGGGYIRERYTLTGSPPYSKYSFRLYFRGDYGSSKLEYPLFGDSPVATFDRIVLRAGMNDPTNPFIGDELVRRLGADMGQVEARGTLCNLFINGVYKGYYNPTERIDSRFLRSWHGGGEVWDVIAQFGEIREGNSVEWNALKSLITSRNLALPANYQEIERRLDLVNFVDYLLINIYAAMGDWPHNNWRAARERAVGAKFRYYIWDAEWSFGHQNPVTHNTITTELNSATDIGNFYRKLRVNPEFKLLFADRIQKHFFNRGALTETNVLTRFLELKTNMLGVLPSMNNTIERTWVPRRRTNIFKHFASAGLIVTNSATPVLSQHGGRVQRGYNLTMAVPAGTIYFTANGVDPRVPFTGAIAAGAIRYTGVPLRLEQSLVFKARNLNGTNWSALAEAPFSVAEIGGPLRITEIMYNPPGDDAYEFVELQNINERPVDLSGMSFEGIDFTFVENRWLGPGEFLVLSSNNGPNAFRARYPNVLVAGMFGGNLSNGGERLALKNRAGRIILSVAYDDAGGWPGAADGGGASLELAVIDGDPDEPAHWQASTQLGGSPGQPAQAPLPSPIQLNEIMAENVSAVPRGNAFPDWIELYNGGATAADLGGWSLSDQGRPGQFTIPAGTILDPGSFLVIWCDTNTALPGLHAGFALGRTGESLSLFDNAGRRVDALGYGLQPADYSLGRVGGIWQLTKPTPGAENETVLVGTAATLTINEWMANPAPGGEDWIELFNRSSTLPVALQNLRVATREDNFFIMSLSFLGPREYALLHADERPGADHLDFKLPASGGLIELYDAANARVDSVQYGVQLEDVSQGRLPDGATKIVSFPSSPSPGGRNYQPATTGLVLNEMMALNAGAVKDTAGRVADWIEIHNPTAATVNLTGMSLSEKQAAPGQWKFPSGVSVAPNGYRVVWFDGSRPASTNAETNLNTGRSLAGEGGAVYLFNAARQLLDEVEYGFQIADRSVGRAGGVWSLLAQPSPGKSNVAEVALGNLANVRLNEWMAEPIRGEDWIELFNPEPYPVPLTGFFLTDDPSIIGQTNFIVGPLSFIGAGSWVLWKADGDPSQGSDHLNFKLDSQGETLRLYSPNKTVIDTLEFGLQRPGVSEGRFRDGEPAFVAFEGSPSPNASNYRLLDTVWINELLSHTDPPLEDAVEIRNASSETVDLSGWFLSDSAEQVKKYRIPDGTLLAPAGFKVFYEFEFNADTNSPTSFSFSSVHGDQAVLAAADRDGNLTGDRAVAGFGPSENGVSFGRFETSAGPQFVPMQTRTFGVDTPSSLDEFRSGRGGDNSYPRVGPIIVNELMVRPEPLGPGEDESDFEFIELHNISSQAVPFYDVRYPTNRWRMGGGVEFEFHPNSVLGPGGYWLVVGFDPATNATALAAFRARFGIGLDTPITGPFRGQLGNTRDDILLLKPDAPQTASGPDAGTVPYIQVDRIDYTDSVPWPETVGPTNTSIQRLVGGAFGNEPMNWTAKIATPGRPNLKLNTDSDSDGLPDDWELAYGFDPRYAPDAAADKDGDGLSNRNEFAAGTDPRDARSALGIQSVRAAHGTVYIRFQGAAGKSYKLESADQIGQRQWTAIQSAPSEPSIRQVELLDNRGLSAAVRFYRITCP